MKMPARRALPRALVAAALTVLSALTSAETAADTQRSHGEQDTSRHAPNRKTLGGSDARASFDHGYRHTVPRARYADDPTSRRFWSPECVQQRESGLSPLNHTRDCDNPAYTGGYRPYPRPYPRPNQPHYDRYGVGERPYRPWGGKSYRPLRPPSSIRPWSGQGGR